MRLNKLIKVLLTGIGILVASSASATSTFNFSYNFYSGISVTGSFSGYLIDKSYQYVSNVSMSIDGVAIGGPLELLSQHTDMPVLNKMGYYDSFQIIGSDGGFSVTDFNDYGSGTTEDDHYKKYLAKAYWASGSAAEGKWSWGNHGGPFDPNVDQQAFTGDPKSYAIGRYDWSCYPGLRCNPLTPEVWDGLLGMGSLSVIEVSNDGAPPPAVPLPAALPLMLSGLGVLGFATRRRK